MSKPFRFKLERVLDFRRQAEEQAMMALSRAREEVRLQEAEVLRLESDLAAHERTYYDKPDMSAAELWLWRQYKERLLLDLSQSRARLADLEARAEKARKVLVEKAKDRKIMEKLKTRQAETHAREERLQEQKEYDEMSTILYEQPDF